MMKIPLLTLGLIVSAISNAMAHPGPPGHTHDDDWPFKLIAVLAVTLLVTYLLKKFVFKKEQS